MRKLKRLLKTYWHGDYFEETLAVLCALAVIGVAIYFIFFVE